MKSMLQALPHSIHAMERPRCWEWALHQHLGEPKTQGAPRMLKSNVGPQQKTFDLLIVWTSAPNLWNRSFEVQHSTHRGWLSMVALISLSSRLSMRPWLLLPESLQRTLEWPLDMQLVNKRCYSCGISSSKNPCIMKYLNHCIKWT